jgi:hypothetical protein
MEMVELSGCACSDNRVIVTSLAAKLARARVAAERAGRLGGIFDVIGGS